MSTAANVIIGGVDISEFIADYNVSSKPFSSDSDTTVFTNWDGKKIVIGNDGITDEDAREISISVSLKKVPPDIASLISEAVKGENISVSYTSPIAGSGYFKCSSYSAQCRKFAETWDISVSLESTAAASSSGGGGL